MSWIDYLQSANWDQASRIFLTAYVLGCFTAGYYLVRLRAGRDIRDVGSGSVGARNVSRVLGKSGFFLTVLFDSGKGALAVWAARHLTTDDRLVAMAMLVVVLGHVWPVQLKFRGGKGMATSLGALLVYDPRLALTFAAVFLCLAALTHRTILPSLFAMASVPFASVWMGHSHAKVTCLSLLAALVFIAHRKNIIEEFSQWAARRHVHPKPDQPHL